MFAKPSILPRIMIKRTEESLNFCLFVEIGKQSSSTCVRKRSLKNFMAKLKIFWVSGRLHYISPSNLRSLLLLLSLQLRDLCPYASIQGLIRPSPPRSRRDQSDRYFLNMVNPRAYL